MEKIPKVFQVFDLDLKRLRKISSEKQLELNLPEAAQSLIQALKEKGYDVLEGSYKHAGLPASLIVVGEIPSEQVIKSDFYEITEKLGLRWFRSGEVYFETR